MSEHALNSYLRSLDEGLKDSCRENGMSEDEIENEFPTCLHALDDGVECLICGKVLEHDLYQPN